MALSNCKKCGKLFQKNIRDICDTCYELQNKLINDICQFVLNSDNNFVTREEIMTQFKISPKDFENFFLSGKFVSISDKLKLKCIRCSNEFIAGRKASFICDNCAKKLKI